VSAFVVVCCCGCGRQKNDAGAWVHASPPPAGSKPSHGLCPEGQARLYPNLGRRGVA
jgi:hypothetical protein